MQAPQLRPRLYADRLDERRARLTVGVQRVSLPAAAIQRQHPQGVQALAQRLLGDERLELADHSDVPAGGQIVLDGELDRGEPQILQPADLQRSEWLRGDIVKRRPAPQRQCVARRSLGHQTLKAPGVDIAGPETQLVAATARDDLGAVPARRQHLAQLRNVDLHHLRRGRRRLLTP